MGIFWMSIVGCSLVCYNQVNIKDVIWVVGLIELDNILRETVDTVRKHQENMFAIAENSREECSKIKKELDDIYEKTSHMIKQVDSYEEKEKTARKKLMKVSKNFDKYSEKDIREAYEHAKNIQIDLALLREREKQLREKRNELERRYKNLKVMVKKAENLVSQVGVAMDFLDNNLQNIWEEVEKFQAREETVFAIIKAQEEERMRIARDIHDGPAQSLANMVMQVEYCQKLLEVRPDDINGELDTLKNITKTNLEGIRKIIFSLRPMDLDDLGLVPAVKRFLNEIEKSSGLIIETKFLGEEQRYVSALEVAVFRIMQEAVNNVIKHAEASTMEVVLETHPSAIGFSVIDDGKGFEDDRYDYEESFGMSGMKERAALLNGDIKISSTPGKGTEISLQIPVQEEEAYG